VELEQPNRQPRRLSGHQLTLTQLNDRPGEKEHAHRIGKTFFRWCVRQHLIDRSPMEKMATPLLGASRDRVLTDDELTAVYRTSYKGRTPFHRLVTLLVLLGLRRTEAANLRWSFFDEATRTLNIPSTLTKNKRTLVIPYGATVSTVVKNTPRFSDTYSFPAARDHVKGKPVTVMTGFSKRKLDFDKECAVSGWRLHDLRRTFATGLQKLGIRLEVTEALLNHVSGTRAGIVGVYQRHDWLPEMREALQLWESKLTQLLDARLDEQGDRPDGAQASVSSSTRRCRDTPIWGLPS
jgi:integrase